jgi:hypothetical protein
MPDQQQPGTDVATTAPLSAELVETFSRMAMIIPEPDDNAMENILEQILGASSWEELADPWDTDNAEKLVGKTIRIDRVTRHPSDFSGGIGVFLVMHGVEMRTGEKIAAPVGSLAVMAQLVRAHTAGWLPLFAEMVIADRPTKEGFRPQHLKFVGQTKREPAAETETAPY